MSENAGRSLRNRQKRRAALLPPRKTSYVTESTDSLAHTLQGMILASEGEHTATLPKATLGDYLAISRPDHWFKNIFMLPGTALAAALSDTHLSSVSLLSLMVGITAVCLLSSANYTINEWFDAEFDRHHPLKKSRPSARGCIRGSLVSIQWLAFASAGLVLSSLLSVQFFIFATALLIMGAIYNIHLIRTKDIPYLDVLSESINNPLRFLLGWAIISSNTLPPSSILLAYWMGGAYLMAVKRYAEFRFIGNAALAGQYRRSFKYYSEESLLLSAFFYALSATFFLGVFLIKYRVEFLLAIPFLALLFVWYLKIGMQKNSVTQKPERLYKEVHFILYVVFLTGLILLLFVVDMPWLNFLVEQTQLPFE